MKPGTKECLSGDFQDTKFTGFESKSLCEKNGYRLCQNQEEVDRCCNTGCNYDYAVTWISTSSTAPSGKLYPKIRIDICQNINNIYI